MAIECPKCGTPQRMVIGSYVTCPNCGTRHKDGLTKQQRASRGHQATHDKKHKKRLGLR